MLVRQINSTLLGEYLPFREMTWIKLNILNAAI